MRSEHALGGGLMAALSDQLPVTRLDQSADPELLEELLDVVRTVAGAGAFTFGAELEAFEREFASYCETSHAIGVSSGTEALVLALRALGIGPGYEVIVPANTFIATAEAVSLVGATPRIVDVSPESHLLTADRVEAAIGRRTRAVIPVHLMGATADMDPILSVAQAAGLRVIEDCSQAHGARYKGRRVGSMGDAGCFSFYPTKNLGAWGDAGAVTTHNATVARRVRLLRSHGEEPRHHHQIVGGTARLDALQAALLRVKLRRLDAVNAQRRRLGAALRAGLREAASLTLPTAPGDHVFHLFVVRAHDRDALREHLDKRGIATAVHYPFPIHRTPAYAHLRMASGSLPVAERLATQICTLPLFPSMSTADVERLIESIHEFDQ